MERKADLLLDCKGDPCFSLFVAACRHNSVALAEPKRRPSRIVEVYPVWLNDKDAALNDIRKAICDVACASCIYIIGSPSYRQSPSTVGTVQSKAHGSAHQYFQYEKMP